MFYANYICACVAGTLRVSIECVRMHADMQSSACEYMLSVREPEITFCLRVLDSVCLCVCGENCVIRMTHKDTRFGRFALFSIRIWPSICICRQRPSAERL